MVKFIQTKDDIIAFSQYSLDQNKSIHRARIIGLGGSIILPLSVFFFMVFIFKMPREAFTWPPITIFICAVLLFSIYGFQKYAVKSRFLKNAVKKAMKGRDHTRAFGPIEITIDKNGLHHKNEFTDERVNWDGIIKIIDTNHYIFLFVTDSSGFIVPNRAFRKYEERDSFLRKAEEYKRNEVS